MSVRAYLNASLTPVLPSSWVIYDYDRTLSALGKVTALYVHESIEPGPEVGSLLHNVVLVIADPTQDEKKAEDRLDDLMEDLIPAIRTIPAIEFQRADKATRDGFPAWRVSLQIKTN